MELAHIRRATLLRRGASYWRTAQPLPPPPRLTPTFCLTSSPPPLLKPRPTLTRVTGAADGTLNMVVSVLWTRAVVRGNKRQNGAAVIHIRCPRSLLRASSSHSRRLALLLPTLPFCGLLFCTSRAAYLFALAHISLRSSLFIPQQ